MTFRTYMAEYASENDLFSTQVNLPRPLADEVQAWGRDHVPDSVLHEEASGEKGREGEMHVTVLYGLKDVTTKQVRHALEHEQPFEVSLGEVSLFRNGEYDVVKIDAKSSSLHDMHDLLRSKFKHRTVHREYIPHVTVAYVRRGTCDSLEGDRTFAGKSFHVSRVLLSDPERRHSGVTLRGR